MIVALAITLPAIVTTIFAVQLLTILRERRARRPTDTVDVAALHRAKREIKSGALLLALLSVFMALPSCQSTAAFVAGGRKTLTIAAEAQGAAWGAWAKADTIHQESIAAKEDEPKAQRRAEIAEYRKVQEKVTAALEALGEVTVSGGKTLDAIEKGTAKQSAFVDAIGAVLAAARAVRVMLTAAGVGPVAILDELIGGL